MLQFQLEEKAEVNNNEVRLRVYCAALAGLYANPNCFSIDIEEQARLAVKWFEEAEKKRSLFEPEERGR